ncbi:MULTISPECIES: hypothetical protein [unclassified Mesorhizobium]|uniref:hypothetical protein n=1 Tax=unclassified Mesorhizobium TaxID=325217 RepID=UPI000FD818E9|nr:MULTISPECIES: hypothetical protein [unclassified Mesorhizobium]TGT76745.1 hypothetical protein EN809_003845 [Mesorhizobium sp. M2E.F.Ca.ET.166.01.1.1]TGW02857.1 hypothetical protein EN797_003845 [Mesorhizobium sp. M2E.F.Ca.ET.154.01.1.1]
MGMDVIGKAATSEAGEYFRNNVWWWRPLADYACEVASEITSACEYWQSNDGDGLDAAASVALADRLQAEIDAGRTAAYAKIHTSKLEQMPNVPCRICAGTGTRLPVPHCGAGDPKAGGIRCNGCEGSGYVRPFDTNYPFSVENVQAFVAFLRACGGFEIN